MSRKRKTYSAEYKAKLVVEVLREERTLNEIASSYEVLPKSLQNWKKQFLENASLAFDKSAVVKEYKEQIETLEREKDATSKKLGEVIVERDFVVGKLKSSVSSKSRKELLETGLEISKNTQLKLLSIPKSSIYYKAVVPFSSDTGQEILNVIDKIYTKYPYYGHRRVHKLLGRFGFTIGRKKVRTAMKLMGIIALYPKPKTTIANKEHQKYPYLLKAFKNDKNQVVIDKPNQVWSTDITYIKLDKGFVYLAAVIDWNTKKILSWKLSNTMDVSLTTGVLKEALEKYDKPEIFNTDQGSQYTAKEHIQILVDNNISISMDGKGRATDNIVIERFWRSLKYEDVYPQSYSTIKEARTGIGKYINIYNTERLHQTLDYATPDEMYFKGVNNQVFQSREMLLDVAS
ncbi:MAG: IS3 family transposase [Sulfurovum sp.]|nr:IS3 family transposase [Sulfurovum sp.]